MRVRYHIFGWMITLLILLSAVLSASFIHPPSSINSEMTKTANKVVHVANNVRQTVNNPGSSSGQGARSAGSSSFLVRLLRATSIIFLNNLRVELLLSIPVFSACFAPSFAVVNGLVIRSLAVDYLQTSPTTVIKILVLAPHTWFEFMAYAIVLFESSVIGWKFIRRRERPSREELKDYFLSLILATVILFIAAVLEVFIIIH